MTIHSLPDRILRALDAPLLALASDGRISYATPAAERLFGAPAEALLGQPWHQLLSPIEAESGSPSEAEPVTFPLLRTLREGLAQRGQSAVARRLDRVPTVLEYEAMPIEGGAVLIFSHPDDNPNPSLAAITDDHARAQHAFNQSLFARRRQPESPAANTAMAVAYLDQDLIYRWNNPLHCEMVGRPVEAIIGRHLYEIRPDYRDTLGPVYERVLNNGETIEILALPVVMPRAQQDVPTFWDLRYLPVYGEGGAIVGMLMVMADASDRLEKERLQARQLETLQQAEALKNQFLAMVSHELRTPIAVIANTSELLASHLEDARGQTLVARVERNAEDLRRLVNDLLDASQLQAGTFAIQRGPVRLAPLIEGLIEDWRPEASAREVRLMVRLAPELPQLRGDENRLKQVLTNLLTNALKHAPPGSDVTVRAGLEDGQLIVEVQDQGPGLDESARTVLFKPFGRVERADGPVHRIGLGLYIAKHVIASHGGTIDFTSTPGQGATFWFSLPVEA